MVTPMEATTRERKTAMATVIRIQVFPMAISMEIIIKANIMEMRMVEKMKET